ncbi:putative uncharacterized protein [Bacteroides fragilis CAG:558]|nr:putative uncharacterized protein [Bacteroides fragilis CAG:558]
MKYKTSLIAILWGSLLCFTLPVLAQNNLQRQKDSLRQVIEHSYFMGKPFMFHFTCCSTK